MVYQVETVAVQELAPPRGRAGDALVISGIGFGSSGNVVTIDGQAAAVTLESTTSITATVPAGIRRDRFIPVKVAHPTDGTDSTRQWWSKPTTAELMSFELPWQPPGEFEDWGAASSEEHPEHIEAKDIEALHEFLQFLPTDVLEAVGEMAGFTAAGGVSKVAAGSPGATLMLDQGEDGGVTFRARAPTFLTWGRQISTATPTLMAANGTANAGLSYGAEQRAQNGGRLTTFFVYIDRQGGTRDIDQVRLLRNGVEVYDSGTGLKLDAQEYHAASVFADAGAVSASDRWSVELTGDAGTSTIDCLAGLVVY